MVGDRRGRHAAGRCRLETDAYHVQQAAEKLIKALLEPAAEPHDRPLDPSPGRADESVAAAHASIGTMLIDENFPETLTALLH